MAKLQFLMTKLMPKIYFPPESEEWLSGAASELLAGSDYDTNGDPIGELDNPDNW